MERKLRDTFGRTGKVVITGPESTGKTNLAIHLAKSYFGQYIPEYAREYISKLNSSYEFNDVLHIAQNQLEQYEEAVRINECFIFFDTWLDITKIWFREVYSTVPSWIDEKLKSIKMDYYLLCAPDIPWEEDPVRENGGEKREFLFYEYEKEIINLGVEYGIVRGIGEARLRMAENLINKHFKLL